MEGQDTGRPLEVGPELHWKDGWHFARVTELGDMLGAVRIRLDIVDGLREERFIPAGEWASIIAAVTPEGNSATTYRMASGLHGVPRAAYHPIT